MVVNKLLTISAISVLALSFVSCAEEPAWDTTMEIGPYTVSLVEKDVWHVEDCNSSNPPGESVLEDGTVRYNVCSDMYIVRGRKKAILIDLSNNVKWADDADESLRRIFYDRAGKREKLIAITHNHYDHTGMYGAFKDEKGIRYLLPKEDFKRDTLFTHDTTLVTDHDVIDLGGMKLECVQCEGHTPGSMIYFLKGHDMAFSGDAIGSGECVWIFDMPGFENYRRSVSRLLKYLEDPASGIDESIFRFLPGHAYQMEGIDMDIQYVRDMDELNNRISMGDAEWEPYPMAHRGLDARFKYGKVAIVWNKALSEAYAARMAAE